MWTEWESTFTSKPAKGDAGMFLSNTQMYKHMQTRLGAFCIAVLYSFL